MILCVKKKLCMIVSILSNSHSELDLPASDELLGCP